MNAGFFIITVFIHDNIGNLICTTRVRKKNGRTIMENQIIISLLIVHVNNFLFIDSAR